MRATEIDPLNNWGNTCHFIGVVASHEAIIATGLMLADDPNTWFSASRSKSRMTALQGDDPGWVQGVTTAHNYSRDSLEPVGFAKHGLVPGNGQYSAIDVVSYRFNPQTEPWKVAAMGLLGQWSLCYPATSLQNAHGRTAKDAQVSSAERRLSIYAEILSSPGGSVPVVDIKGLNELGNHTGDIVDELERRELLSVDSVEDDNDRQFELLSPDYTGDRPLNSLRIETQLAYKFFQTLQPGEIFTKQQLLDYVTGALRRDHSGFNLVDSRDHLNGLVGSHDSLPRIQRLGNYNGSDTNTSTRVRIAVKHRDAIEELLEIVLGLDERKPKTITAGQDLASQFVGSPDKFSSLMAKAFRFSGNAQTKGSVKNMAAILDVLRESQLPLTKEELCRDLGKIGIKLTKQSISSYLTYLQGDNTIQLLKETKNDINNRVVNRYTIVEPSA